MVQGSIVLFNKSTPKRNKLSSPKADVTLTSYVSNDSGDVCNQTPEVHCPSPIEHRILIRIHIPERVMGAIRHLQYYTKLVSSAPLDVDYQYRMDPVEADIMGFCRLM